MRRRKQGAKTKKKVTFITRKQLRHSSCPPEDFEAVLEEQGSVPIEQLSEKKPLSSQPKHSAMRLQHATSRKLASKHRQPPSPPPQSPLPPQEPPSGPQPQRLSKSSAAVAAAAAPDYGRYLSDTTTAATLRTLLAIPSAPATPLSAPQHRPSGHALPPVPAPAGRKTEQRILLTQCRPPVDAVDNKAVVEQMMKRLSNLLRTLHPKVAENPKIAAKMTLAAMSLEACRDVSVPQQPELSLPSSQPPRQPQQPQQPCAGSLTPGKYDWLLRQLAKRRRSQAAVAATAAAAAPAPAPTRSPREALVGASEPSRSDSSCSVRSDWEKKLLYEK